MKIKIATILVAVFLSQYLSTLLVSQVNTQWISRYNSSLNNNDVPTCMAYDNNGNLYVGGMSYGSSGTFDYLLVKYNANGEELWSKSFNGSGSQTDQLNSIAIDKDNNIFVTGNSTDPEGLFDIVTIKYSPDGEVLWKSTFNGQGKSNDGTAGIVIDTEGNIYVAGYSASDEENVDIVAIKMDNKSGDIVWKSQYNNPGNNSDYATGIAIDASNSVYICGYSKYLNSDFDYVTIKYTVNGAKMWAKTYNGTKNAEDKASAIKVGPSGEVYVTGQSMGNNSNFDYTTLKYTPQGELELENRFNGTGNGADQPAAMLLDKDGNVYITGQSFGGGTGLDFATVKYNAQGVELWNARYNGEGSSNDVASALYIDDMGSVYVTGYVWNGSSNDFSTIKYNPLGTEIWISKYNGPANQTEKAVCVLVDNKGGVFVTGSSVGTGTQNDMAVIKYSQSGPEAVPQLIAPSYGASGINQSATLEWSQINTCDYCRLQIANDKNFSKVVYDTVISVGNTQVTLREGLLEDNTQYFWKVCAANIAGSGQWTMPWTFSVLNAPDSPQPLSPQNGAAGLSVTPTLSWQNSPTAETYRLQIAKDINFSEVVHDINTLATNEYTLPSGLLNNNHQYFWRVNASNSGGTVPWSNTWSMGTGFVNPPQQPQLISLPSGSLGQSLTPVLDWSDLPSVTNYRLQISSDLNFTTIVVDEGNLHKSVYAVPGGKLKNNTLYYWRVSAENMGGAGHWSLIYTFCTLGVGLTQAGKNTPAELELHNNSPEPFSTTTTITFDIPKSCNNNMVTISVYDKMGIEVSKILDDKVKAGTWSVQWDGTNFPRGYYFYVIRTKGLIQTKKMFLVK